RLFAPSIAVTSHVLKQRFQIAQPLLGQGETGAQLGHGLDRSRERVHTRRLGAVHVMTAVFLATREEQTRDRASEYRLAASRQPRCLPQRVSRHVTPSILGVFKRVTRCATRPIPVTVRTRWLTIGEGGHAVATAEHCSYARTRQRADRWASHPAPIAVEYARAGHCGQGCTARRSVRLDPFETGA